MLMNLLTHWIFPNAHYVPGTVLGVTKVAGIIRHSWVFQKFTIYGDTNYHEKDKQQQGNRKRGSFCESRNERTEIWELESIAGRKSQRYEGKIRSNYKNISNKLLSKCVEISNLHL